MRRASVWMACAAAFLCVALSQVATPARAATQVDFVVSEQAEGYARMVLTFPTLPEYTAEVASGVLVISFKEEMWTRLDESTLKAPSFVVIGRVDPDGRAFRFALGQAVRVNTMEAAEQLYIDLLPMNWTGLPPSLPTAVVDELVRRAASAEEAAIRDAQRRALEESEYRLRVRVGEQPTFSRIVFDWGAYVGVSVSRDENKITLNFDQFAVVPMERLKSDPPRYVEAAEQLLSDEGVGIELTITPGSSIRGFREENTYVLDVLAPEGVVEDDNNPLTLVEASAGTDGAQDFIEFKGDTAGGEAGNGTGTETPGGEAMAGGDAAQTTEVTAMEPLDTGMAGASDVDESRDGDVAEVIVSHFDLNHNATGLAGEPDDADSLQTSAEDEAPIVVGAASPEVVSSDSASQPGSEPMQADGSSDTVVSDARNGSQGGGSGSATSPVVVRSEFDGRTLRLYFPFDRDIPSAVFRRSNVLWVVFDTDRTFDLEEALGPETAEMVRDVRVSEGDGVQVLRLFLREYALASTAQEAHTWVLSLGDRIITPAAPVSLRRGLRTDGRSKVTIDFPRAGAVHRLRDPDVGDNISVVTGMAPQRGFTRPQEFVEFRILETAHGLAVLPLTDDLVVRLVDETVLVTRPSGLTISAGRVSAIADAPEENLEATRPGFIDYEKWSSKGVNFVGQMLALETAIADVEPSQTMSARFDLTRLFLASGLGSEALGQLALIDELDPEIAADPIFTAMRGISYVLMHRPADARADLTSFTLADDPHAALWRGLMEMQARNWTEAAREFHDGHSVIDEYPEEVQTRFRLAEARAAIEAGDYSSAEVMLQGIADQEPTGSVGDRLALLQGRALAGEGRSIEAIELLDAARRSPDQMVEAEADYNHMLLALELGQISRAEFAARLEALAIYWRGDDLELNTLRQLGRYYAEEEDYRRALTVMKVAVTNYPGAEISRQINDDMSALFEDLFLNDKADSLRPIDALALYYEYRELTPVGRRGDEMIRHLADRLIAVDLLDQAADILSHQVDKRLVGAARAQVAAKLAMVHLMNREPDLALQAIRRTRQAVLPQHIQIQRRIVEARALSELGRTDTAIDLLANIDGTEALNERAEAYWKGERWQSAAESFERLLSERENKEEPLSARDRINVLRAAISYVLSDDMIGARRLRAVYGEAMTGTREHSAFEAITGGLDRDGTEFRNLAGEIASIDTLEQFLEDFRKHFDEPMVGADAS